MSKSFPFILSTPEGFLKDQELLDYLNSLGQQGWELVAVVPNIHTGDTIGFLACFKRPIE